MLSWAVPLESFLDYECSFCEYFPTELNLTIVSFRCRLETDCCYPLNTPLNKSRNNLLLDFCDDVRLQWTLIGKPAIIKVTSKSVHWFSDFRRQTSFTILILIPLYKHLAKISKIQIRVEVIQLAAARRFISPPYLLALTRQSFKEGNSKENFFYQPNLITPLSPFSKVFVRLFTRHKRITETEFEF